ncbi:MYND-type domain-containing protein [Madurella fahalii]|uniref:MYND-type domain-containing protein n=1 Tax=Madurella fahalii TaxID=1157608 RepID=A0ABQ0FYX5_9PEZI
MESSSPKCGHSGCTRHESRAPYRVPVKCPWCDDAHYCSSRCKRRAWPTHKNSCSRPNYILEVQLDPDYIRDPPVNRTLSCPANATFLQLHKALQVAFGWSGVHLFEFTASNPDFKPAAQPGWFFKAGGSIARGQEDADEDVDAPKPEKRPVTYPPHYLLRITDPEDEWDTSFEDPDTVVRNSSRICLWQIFDNESYRRGNILYNYDFGDGWEHKITVKGRDTATDHFVCLSGSGHPVAEDVGGHYGWEELKKAYRTANPDEHQLERRRWYERAAMNGDRRGLAGDIPNEWNKRVVNDELEQMKKRSRTVR